MAIPTLVTGDDVTLPVTLKKNDATFSINPAASVKVRLVSSDHTAALSDEVAQSSLTSGADWAHSLVVVVLPAATSGVITTYGAAKLEIQVADSGKTTWFVPVTVIRGTIA